MAKAAAKKNKGASRNAAPPKKPAPGWLWLITGFITAGFVFFLVHLYQGGSTGKIRALIPGEVSAATAGSDQAATAQAGSPEAASGSGEGQQHFDFYTLLPNQRVIPNKAAVDAGNRAAATVASSLKEPATAPVPPSVATTAPPPTTPTTPTTAATIEPRPAKASYFLQAGSFHSEAEADRRRASIILLGLPVTTEHFSKDGQSWFRVVVGPLASKEGQQSAKASLKGGGIDSVPLKQG